MKECKPSFEKCIIDRCPYYHEFIEIVSGDVHMRIRCEKQDISLTNRKEEERRMRLIDADALLKYKSDHETISTHLIYNTPTIDAVPVRHGSWIIDPHSQHGFPLRIYLKRKCSECGHSVDNPTPYCPWCGAKMDGERKEE